MNKRFLNALQTLPALDKTGKGEGYDFAEYSEIKSKIIPRLTEMGFLVSQECSSIVRENLHIEVSVVTKVMDTETGITETLSSVNSFVSKLSGLNTQQSLGATFTYLKRIALINDLQLVIKDAELIEGAKEIETTVTEIEHKTEIIEKKKKPLSLGTKTFLSIKEAMKNGMTIEQVEKDYELTKIVRNALEKKEPQVDGNQTSLPIDSDKERTGEPEINA